MIDADPRRNDSRPGREVAAGDVEMSPVAHRGRRTIPAIAFVDMRLPPEDLSLSPHTGYTRAHWEAVAETWLSHALRHASPQHALFRIPGRHAWSGPESDALEGYARSFLLAAGLIASGRDRQGLAERYAQGLLAGTRRAGPEEWLRGVDCVPPLQGKTQPTVEAANVAFALHVCRAQIWDRLDGGDQEQVVDWLEHHARLEVWPNNWVLFTAVVEAFLASVGVDTSRYRGDADVRLTESWHLGDGWHTDGSRRNVDYYNAWVIHPFLWAWYDMVGARRDPDAAWRWRRRLADFCRTYAHFFGGNGAPVFAGRSLTYRTATLAPLWTAELAGVAPLAPGATRRLASGTLKYFVDAGVGAVGPPSLGWREAEYLPMTQTYSGPGSPYFAGIGFLGLALPPDNPVWTDVEAEQPSRDADATVALRGAGWLVHSTKADGVVRVLNHGSDHINAVTPEPDPCYAKLAYTSHTAPGFGEAFDEGCDGEFVGYDADGNADRRRRILTHRVDDAAAISVGEYLAGSVVTASAVHGPFEVRCHRLDGFVAARVREGGYSVAGDARVRTGRDEVWSWAQTTDGLVAAVAGLHGYARPAAPCEHSHGGPLGKHSAAPGLHADGGDLFVALHVLTVVDDVAEALPRWRRAVDVSVDGPKVTLRWRDGEEIALDLAAVPAA
ncbi:MAG: DUF2264 domain-containing protein [Stackebrandtia sp.]